MVTNLNEVLDIIKPESINEVEILPPKKDTDVKTSDQIDFEVARENIKSLITKGEEALEGIIDLAREGEHPRAYEVAGQLIKTLVDANRDLMTIHKQAKDLKEKGKEENSPSTVNNNLIVGSASDIQLLIEARRKEMAEAQQK